MGAKAQNVNKNSAAPKPAPMRVKALVAALDSFRNRTPVEKVHIHFDKPYYSVGDTIWLKAYVVNENNELSLLSNILYVDLVNDKDSVKINMRLSLSQGLGWAAMTLSDSLLRAGNYHIHAYTNWMRNFGSDYYFNKAIKIGNARAVQKTTANNSSSNRAADVSVQFFPEGGDLVDNITSRIAFKAIGADGLSQEISGYIIDQANKQITTFKAAHAGMGSFMLEPATGNRYTAVIKLKDGSEKHVELPKAMQHGYVITATQNEDNLFVKVNVSNSLLQKGDILLVAQANNTVQYAAQKALIRTDFTTVIPKSRFPEGILQLTLFSPDYQPVAERLVFIRHDDMHLNINVIPDKQTYKQREKVRLNVQVTDKAGAPVVGSFSVAVTDENKVPTSEADENTIFSNLLLTSELKGYIEQPNYYFTDNDAAKTQQLDNLLLTQGWRRFAWKNILANDFPAMTYKVENGVGISGRVVSSRGEPVPNARVYIFVNSGSGIVIDTLTGADGRFTTNNLILRKGVDFKITAENGKGNKKLRIEIDKPVANPIVYHDPVIRLPDDGRLATYLKNDNERFAELDNYGLTNHNSITLDEVVVKDVAVKHSASLAGGGHADQVLTFIDLLDCPYDLAKCLQGRLTNVFFRADSTNMLGSSWLPYSRGYSKPMLVVVDGIQRPDGLTSVMSSDVASIEVLRGGGAASLYGLHGDSGVIIITTKKGDVDYDAYEEKYRGGPPLAKKVVKNIFNGYDMRREFYAPDYDNPATNKQMADLRSTIAWSPNMVTKTDGKAVVQFFNADGAGNYHVVIEGLNEQGKLGRQVLNYTVK
ncbi:MAG TPA: TonB-dependent receptor plug domain-containing protein [Mucilaginibacter sp.]|nr:TonB-dependent receptor plug domain-containing protein [Mucilaginibacter sp.]